MPHPTRNPKLKTIFIRVVGKWMRMMLIKRRRRTQHTVHFRCKITALGENKYFAKLRIAFDPTLLPLSPKPVTIVVVESSMSFDFTASGCINQHESFETKEFHLSLRHVTTIWNQFKKPLMIPDEHKRVEDIFHTISIAPESDLTVFYSSVVCTERKCISIDCGRDRIE